MLPSYRNQSVDLLCKSTDWFLHDRNIGHYKVNLFSSFIYLLIGLAQGLLYC